VLATRIQSYREARGKAGLDPDEGRVTLSIHTFLAESVAACREKVRAPFMDYLRSSVEAWSGAFRDLKEATEREREKMLELAFERYFRTAALFGTVESCLPLVERLYRVGVDELACFVDFGLPDQEVFAGLEKLAELRARTSNWTRQ